MFTIMFYILSAGGISTTYGYPGDMHCGDIGKVVECSYGAITASGEIFDPILPTAAIFSPTTMVMRSVVVPIRLNKGVCKFIRFNDKGNPRYIGNRSFDVTKITIKLLGGVPSRVWSGYLTVCRKLLNKDLTKLEIIKWNIK